MGFSINCTKTCTSGDNDVRLAEMSGIPIEIDMVHKNETRMQLDKKDDIACYQNFERDFIGLT